MKTDTIRVSSRGAEMETALKQAEKVAAYKSLGAQSALQLRLLTEEMMGLMRSITGETEGAFWIEDEEGVYQLHLKTENRMDEKQKEELISVSSEGRNEAARGLMGKIRTFFEPAGGTPVFAGLFMPGSSPQMYQSMSWSMTDYKKRIARMREERQEGAEEAWDELEKSVVAHVADDIRVSIRGREAELIIIKKLA